MTGDFMADWFTLVLAATVGLGPFTVFWGMVRAVVGNDPPEQGGCAVGIMALAVLLMIAAPFLGYWCFQTFAVVWRP